jgi:hypothetical protein
MQVRDLFHQSHSEHRSAGITMMRSAMFLMSLLVIAACAAGTGLVKPGGTAEEFQRDHAACVSWMYGVSTPRGRGAVRWAYYDWCMQKKGYRKAGVVANGGFEPPTKGL